MAEYKQDVVYIVVRGNNTLLVGDHFWIDSLQGFLNSVETGGWLNGEDMDAALEGIKAIPAQGWLVQTDTKPYNRTRAYRQDGVTAP